MYFGTLDFKQRFGVGPGSGWAEAIVIGGWVEHIAARAVSECAG